MRRNIRVDIAEFRRAIKNLNMFNDMMMQAVFESKLAVQHVLRVIMRDKRLKVKSVASQKHLPEVMSRSGVLDVLALDGRGRLINIEIQCADNCDHARRVRYYAALLDSRYTPKGEPLEEHLPDLYVIYITLTDIWGDGCAVQRVENRLLPSGRVVDNGLHVIYVNAAIDDGSDVAELMRYFKTCDAGDSSQGALSRRVRDIKEGKGGFAVMDEWTKKFWDDGNEQGMEKGLEKGRKQGMRQGRIKGKLEGKIETMLANVRSLMANMGFTLEKAMDALGLSVADRKICIAQMPA